MRHGKCQWHIPTSYTYHFHLVTAQFHLVTAQFNLLTAQFHLPTAQFHLPTAHLFSIYLLVAQFNLLADQYLPLVVDCVMQALWSRPHSVSDYLCIYCCPSVCHNVHSSPLLYYQQRTKTVSLTSPWYNRGGDSSVVSHSSGSVWESRWTSRAVRPNEPSGFRGRKDLLNCTSALVTACP